MGTSSWQNIPYCIDALMKIEPRRVLDVGVGFGRWGIVVREFCDVWFQRVLPEEWLTHIEGIEGFDRNVSDYHRSFYNRIHIGDAVELAPKLPGPWDVTIYGDVLEHFTRDDANRLLNGSIENSKYVLLNIPLGEDYPQDDLYGNEFERHRSSWDAEDFDDFPLVRRALFLDFRGRPFGSFVFSKDDPRELRRGLFSAGAVYNDSLSSLSQARALVESRALQDRIAEQAFELNFIKSHSTYKIAQRLRATPVWEALRWLRTRNSHVAIVEALGEASPASQATEVWLVQASRSETERSIPWDFVDHDASWHARAGERAPYGRCLMSRGGKLRVALSTDPRLTFVKHPWSGRVRVTFQGQSEVFDLFSEETGSLTIYPGRRPMTLSGVGGQYGGSASLLEPGSSTASYDGHAQQNGHIARPKRRVHFTHHEERFIESLQSSGATSLAVHCPRWLGITNATRTLFEHLYPFPATEHEDPFKVDAAAIHHHAEVIAATAVEQVVFSGGDEVNLRLLDELHELRPNMRFDLLWHGSYVQFCEDYAWTILQKWIRAARDGRLHSIGVVKKGMEQFFESLGIRSSLVLNYVPGEPMAPPGIDDDAWHLGMWISGSSYRKIPHAMLAAVRMVENARLHAAGLDERSREVIQELEIDTAEVRTRPIPYDRLLAAMRRTHLSLYVTFSECCPMLPLESLSVGVPCLLGPTSHLFEDDPFLYERLVVPCPDRADVIAEYIRRALDEREAIMAEYARYAPRYEERARRSVESFLAGAAVEV